MKKIRLKERREALGMTQRQVADAVGIAESAYQRYEYGDRTPPMETLIALADLYDISLDELVCRERH